MTWRWTGRLVCSSAGGLVSWVLGWTLMRTLVRLASSTGHWRATGALPSVVDASLRARSHGGYGVHRPCWQRVPGPGAVPQTGRHTAGRADHRLAWSRNEAGHNSVAASNGSNSQKTWVQTLRRSTQGNSFQKNLFCTVHLQRYSGSHRMARPSFLALRCPWTVWSRDRKSVV